MKLRVEIVEEDADEEIIVRCRSKTEQVRQIEHTLEALLETDAEMAVTLGNTEYYLSKRDILFFETYDGKITVHTDTNMYYTQHKLFELEAIMPPCFVRVSKSCILNAAKVSSLSHNLTGASRATFYGTDKIVYVSRSYYKYLKEKIHELRFRNQNGSETRR